MRKLIYLFAFLSLCTLASAQDLWVNKDGNIRNVDTRDIAMGRGDMYLATRFEVYRSSDPKVKWESVFTVPIGENEINAIAAGPGVIFTATKRGLFRSEDHGKTWKNVFRTIIPEKNNIQAIEISRYNSGRVVVGTVKGIFLSETLGDEWADISGNLKNVAINCLAINKDDIYAGGEDGLFLKKKGFDGWERIYVNSVIEKTDSEEAEDYIEMEESQSYSGIGCITFKGGRLYAGCGKKIICSDDGGKTWSDFSTDGLSGMVNHIAISIKEEKIYCATTKGVFEFDRDKIKWQELYKGMDKVSGAVRLVFDGDDSILWALTSNGLYTLESGHYVPDSYGDLERNIKSFKVLVDNEPRFEELQRAAMKFAEVDPEKIKRWRAESKLKALLPKISVGIDKNSSTTQEIYTSATKDYIVVGPEDVSNGFDISVSWELADLIWSNDQTSIDTRSRLTTQLRNDILDDLRRAYFERKRLQFELISSPPKDVRLKFEKELRVQELTQALDDLTGNYVSKNTKK